MIIYINVFKQCIKQAKKLFHVITVLNQTTTGSTLASNSNLTTECKLILIQLSIFFQNYDY